MVTSFRDVIDACGQASALARALGMRVNTVQKWRDRDNIPPEYWRRVIDIARTKGRKITADRLMHISAKNAPIMQAKPRKKRGDKRNGMDAGTSS